jgi:hypothetical protein
MYKYLFILICWTAIACTQNTSSNNNTSIWPYQPQNHRESTDAQCQPIVAKFQELLKGVINKDTAYTNRVANEMKDQLDSFATMDLSKDTLLNNDIKAGFYNIAAELEGVIISNSNGDMQELKISINMCAIQILNLLGKIGYKHQNIYIFHTTDIALEDGLYWFGLQKIAKNPYQPEQKKEVEAVYMLQEK